MVLSVAHAIAKDVTSQQIEAHYLCRYCQLNAHAKLGDIMASAVAAIAAWFLLVVLPDTFAS